MPKECYCKITLDANKQQTHYRVPICFQILSIQNVKKQIITLNNIQLRDI